MGEEQQQKAAMAFEGMSHSAITERTGDNSSSGGEQCIEESTTTGYGVFYNNNGSRNADRNNESVANSCSNSSSQSSTKIHEHDYIGLAGDSSSASVDQPQERSSMAEVPDLNLGLRLGPPKKDCSMQQLGDKEKALFQENASVGAVYNSIPTRLKLQSAGSKRGYSETVEAADLVKGMSSKLLPAMFPWSSNSNNIVSGMNKPFRPTIEEQRSSFAPFQRKDSRLDFSCLNHHSEETPTSSGPMVGWPPVQSFRKNTLVAPNSQTAKSFAERDPSEQITGASSLFVKVYMDGVPIGRKVDLDSNNSYLKLSSALKEMFSGFINGQNSSKQKPVEVHNLFESYETEYVLTYEDKDGDLMLVGDVPWRMFAATVKRLRIMKGSDAIGLGVPKDFEGPTNRTKAAS